ncbi:translation initiation factor IF-2-like [Psammomys obesus]|uniref:translation initiation factor IF-2-like n=1 Tax=Psammomys obesus TaxID=48139 RepID=UPI002452F8F6|nr:translation initiation factor IF-2-like [Psammomys obesus]
MTLALRPLWRSRPGPRPLTGRQSAAAGESRTDAHAELDKAALSAAPCNGNAPANPAQPDPAQPLHATSRPGQGHTPTRAPPPATRPCEPRLVPGPATSRATVLLSPEFVPRQDHAPTMARFLTKNLRRRHDPCQATPCHVLATLLLRLRGARLLHVHSPLCGRTCVSHGPGLFS